MENIIEIKNLKKSFGNKKAVDDISFAVKKGQLFAFLGLNGAGKSTTINILVCVQQRDSGDCYIEGKSIDNIAQILPSIGIVFQTSVLDKKLSIYDNLKYSAMLYDLSKDEFENNLQFFNAKLSLNDLLKRHRKIKILCLFIILFVLCNKCFILLLLRCYLWVR